MDDSNENFLQYINSFDFQDTEILNNNSFGLTETQKLINTNFSETPYYSPESVRQKLSTAKNKLSFIHLNIRSMGKNFEDFKFFLNQLSYNFSFICLTETWCKETLEKTPLSPSELFSCISKQIT